MADQEHVRPIEDPFSGEKLHAVAAAKPDVAILHGYWADRFGNIQAPAGRNSDDVDTTIAKAADVVIVTVEKIVSARGGDPAADPDLPPAELGDGGGRGAERRPSRQLRHPLRARFRRPRRLP